MTLVQQKTLMETIFQRKSVREFQMETLDEKFLKSIETYFTTLLPLQKEQSSKIVIIDAVHQVNEKKGMFHIKAPYYLAFYTKKTEDYMLNAGYLMEQMLLYLSSKGLGTCFVASDCLARPKEEDKEVYVIALAFGFPVNSRKVHFKIPKLPVKEICVFKEEVDTTIKAMVDAVRKAPSSLNSQPWRLVAYNNRIHLFAKSEKYSMSRKWRMFNMGIALAHILMIAEDLWIDATVSQLPDIANKDFQNNEYVTSVLLNR